jgi:hypothetical protein
MLRGVGHLCFEAYHYRSVKLPMYHPVTQKTSQAETCDGCALPNARKGEEITPIGNIAGIASGTPLRRRYSSSYRNPQSRIEYG